MKATYFEALTRAARWRLPPAEAQEVLEDYAAMLEETPRSEEDLRREVGDPTAAVMALVEPKKYRRWAALFILALAAVALILTVLFLMHSYALDDYGSPGWWYRFFAEYLTITLLGLAGTGVALC